MAGRDSNGYPNQMAMSWNTLGSTSTSTCMYSTSPSLSNPVTVTGTQSSYLQTWQHHVVSDVLKPATLYYYSCGDSAAGMSAVSNFTSAGGASQDQFTILQVADMGVYNSYDSRQLIGKLAPSVDWLLWSGDVCYADDAFLHDPLGFGYELTWDTCQTWLSNTTSFTPFMVGPGNHEAECHSPACLLNDTLKETLHNFTAYTHRFRMPSDVSAPRPGTLNQWYRYVEDSPCNRGARQCVSRSFNYGPVHFVVYDGETSYPNSPNDSYTGLPNGDFGDQVGWMQQDLAFAASPSQRAMRPWIVVTSHR
jgi:acid phosphatase type 7